MLIGIHDWFNGKFDAEIVSTHNRELKEPVTTAMAVASVCTVVGGFIALYVHQRNQDNNANEIAAFKDVNLYDNYWVTISGSQSDYNYYYAYFMGYNKGENIPKDQCTIPYTNFITEETFKEEIRRDPKFAYISGHSGNLIDQYSQYQSGFYHGLQKTCCS